jgi:hypothetical protein
MEGALVAISHGPSLYYVSDKNIFDALNQPRVDNETVRRMFQRRNIVCSRHTAREELARYFSSLTHDFSDHQDIAARLGMLSRRERTTSVDIKSTISAAHLDQAAARLADAMRKEGDVVQVTRDGKKLAISIKYSEVDYRQNEFRQLQHRDGVIEFVEESGVLVLRSTQAEHISSARDELLREVGAQASTKVETVEVSLFEYPSPRLRSKFFYDLMNELPGYVRSDVTDVYVHKAAKVVIGGDSSSQGEEEDGDIQRILMRGSAITRSRLLNDLLKDEKYYIFRVAWRATEKLGKGYAFDIEALFHNPETCTGFTYLLKGVYVLEDGRLSKYRRLPYKEESDAIARAVETAARKLMKDLAGTAS